MKRSRFFLVIFLFYTAVNIFFALLYFATGVEHLVGGDGAVGYIDKFIEAFFFSSQTLTTVGYGRVAPSGLVTNIIASFESLIGILIFSVMTGLIYGRFARPRAYLFFSPNILIAPFKEGKALMLRTATYKNNHLTDVEAQLTLAMHVPDGGKTVTKFYNLKLDVAKINSLALSWTLVHPIDEDSPLYSYTKEDVKALKMEVIVIIKAFDDHFSNVVQQRTSYDANQVVYGAKFRSMFERAPDGSHTLLELNRINDHETFEFKAESLN
jgi:inward rectifier potassium channel